MRIGILGGTYDPIHVGHLALAQAAHRELRLDLLYFVPSCLSPVVGEEKCAASAHLRFQMVKQTIESFPSFRVSDFELNRGGVSYAVDTIREFRKQYPIPNELFLMVGSDWAGSLEKWKEINTILVLCQVVMATRPGFQTDSIPKSAQLLPFEAIDISSSRIREMVRQGKSVDSWVPKPAHDLIRKHQLYQTPS